MDDCVTEAGGYIVLLARPGRADVRCRNKLGESSSRMDSVIDQSSHSSINDLQFCSRAC